MKGYGNRATINVGGTVSTTEIKGKELVREDEITQYLEVTGGGAFTPEELQNAVSNYLSNHPISPLTPEQSQKLSMLLTDGNGEKYLGDDGNYHNIPRDGVDGQNGTNGVDGSDGVGISNITANQSGENVTLTISLTDGTSEQVTFTAQQGGVTESRVNELIDVKIGTALGGDY